MACRRCGRPTHYHYQSDRSGSTYRVHACICGVWVTDLIEVSREANLRIADTEALRVDQRGNYSVVKKPTGGYKH